ncbi:MAG: hypothetical protein BEN19_04705 [Epulopiscium sp. Nuni2H_MBin003]|nr:MAG: hypothetical protein BEN19_04705 [Epulopiscium sp. Nuni2H_MBin003]
MTDNLEVHVKLKFNDILRYNLYIGYRGLFRKLTVIIGIVIWGYLIYKFSGSEVGVLDFISNNIILLIVAFITTFSRIIKIYQITLQQMQSAVATSAKYIFDAEKIYLQLGQISDTIDWQTYIQVIETKNDFRFFVDDVQAQIIPKHALKEEQIPTLRALIKTATTRYTLKG